MAIDVGTGILGAAAIFAITLSIWKLIERSKKNNPNSKFLLTEVFKEYREGTKIQLEGLSAGLSEVKESIKGIHERMNELNR